MSQPNSISDVKAAFYDAQRHASNMLEALGAEVLALNAKVKELEEVKAPEPKAKPSKP